jgi:hypothetical protein
MFRVVIHVSEENSDSSDTLAEIWRWVSFHPFYPLRLRYTFGTHAVEIEVEFATEREAAAFAGEFGGATTSNADGREGVGHDLWDCRQTAGSPIE